MAEVLSPAARRTAEAVARAALPPGQVFPGADARTVDRVEELLGNAGSGVLQGYAGLLRVFEQTARSAHRGRAFSSLNRDEAESFLSRWADAGLPRRIVSLALVAPLKVAHFDDPGIYEKLKCTWRFKNAAEPERFMAQVSRGEDLDSDLDLDCDVVVVGTGAGGAVVAKELAERGLAVLMLEEGRYHTREEFNGSAIDAISKFYRLKGRTGAIGNAFIPIPMGRMVGGSTAINTGTCWRTPDWILHRWGTEMGLTELSPEALAPHFDRVERELQVEIADWKFLGGVARVIARGSDALGYSHRPLRRNAPACDGSGVCDYGCPTDARRSTNISYVPAALKRGAQLYTGVRADEVLIEDGRAAGLVAHSTETGKTLRVRSRATVLSCGTLLTPLLLRRLGLHRGLPQIGRNLSIHPATTVSALFDEEIRGYAAIPQGYCVDEFHREGILFMGASAPIDLGAAQFFIVGKKLVEIMEAYDRVASFGVMVEDASVGRVLPGPDGRPLVLYWLGRHEQERLRRGTEILSRIYLAAGAREVYPALHGFRVLRTPADLGRLAASRPSASDWLLSAFHPLGTCRMARDKKNGVVSTDHEVFGVPALYIADGSVVPSSIGVNPQETIMALATRCAGRLADRLAARSS
jgi:choline dehydrogenase-like flavoprotein